MRVSFGKQIKKLSKEEYFNLVKSGNLENIKNSFQKKEIKAPNETDDENQNVLFAMMIELQNDEKCLNILKYLCLEQHIDPSIMDNNQQNLLFYSCAEGLLECTKFLLDNKFNISVNSIDKEGNTPLFYAVRNNCFSIVKYLIENHNCNINYENKENKNCLYEMQEDNAEMIKYLLSKGAQSNIYLRKLMRQTGQFNVYNILCGNDNNESYNFYCFFHNDKQIDSRTINDIINNKVNNN
jgi:ankyrin repeat protein